MTTEYTGDGKHGHLVAGHSTGHEQQRQMHVGEHVEGIGEPLHALPAGRLHGVLHALAEVTHSTTMSAVMSAASPREKAKLPEKALARRGR